MNKQRFINILQDFDNIPDHDRRGLHELAKLYPYSQIIHTLIAKAHSDAQTRLAGQTLNYAAMYAADRSHLKEIILHIPEEQPHRKNNVARPSPGTNEPLIANNDPLHLEAEDLRKEIWLDLAALKKSKASYLKWEEEKQHTLQNGKKDKIQEEKAIAKAAPISEKKVKQKKGESKAARQETKTTVKRKSAKAKKSTSKVNPHQDQKAIIEKFINEEPSIAAKPLKSSENQPDLSESSTAFNEDLVSENLAQIFVNQGKKRKAIDIYKKLIWKFPQKKSYFATQIEELQK